MDSDSYKIIVSISRRRVAFEYWQRDGGDKLIPFPSGKWPAPLAIYCSPTGVILGDDALRAVVAGTENAFTDYFDHLSDAETCSVGGETRPVRNLLLEGVEGIFNDFYRNVLIRVGSLSDNRANMPLVIVCESDVRPHERAFLKGLFRDSGYSHVSVESYDDYIQLFAREELAREYKCRKVLVAWSEGPDLTFTLFDLNGTSPRKTVTFEGLGIDPRKEYVKKLIWERIQGQNPWLQFAEEEEALDRIADDFLNSNRPLVEDTVVLSDGQRYHYSLNRNSIDYYKGREGISVQDKLEEFLRDNGVIDRSDVLLLLRGNIAGNSYFEQNLRQGFLSLVRSDKRLRQKAMRLIIDGKRPVSVNVEDSSSAFGDFATGFDSHGGGFGGFTTGFGGGFESPAAAFSTSTPPPIPKDISSPQPVDAVAAKAMAVFEAKKKQLKREWRSVKGQVNGKLSLHKYDEACRILQSFESDCEKAGVEELLEEAKLERMRVMVERDKMALKTPPQKPERPSGASSHRRVDHASTSVTSSSVNRKPEPEKKPIEEGKKLASLGKLKEARDWYRQQGDTVKAKVIGDIIRAQKSVNHRKSDLAECQQIRDAMRIGRIVKELEEYLDLCEKGGVPSAEYRKLLSDYKKIKV
ncbi:MAG: hypothetical protein K2N05_11050 [Muribaculaceae bacterium]|nr:hypothetical protein [Muribaculaceae bacterium]